MDLVLISPYTPPARHALSLGAAESACWLNGWAALWHPAALAQAAALPRWTGPYDLDGPFGGAPAPILAARPVVPSLQVAADFEERIRDAGGTVFAATADRAETLRNLLAAMSHCDPHSDVAPEPFFGLAFGYLVIDTLFEAMERERRWDRDGFWADMRAALAPDGSAQRLRSAAEKLLAARETLYPAAIHLLDFVLAETEADVIAAAARPDAINLVCVGQLLESLDDSESQSEIRNPISDIRNRLHQSSSQVEQPTLEICGGIFIERADDLLPLESQRWNLHRGREAARQRLGVEVGSCVRRLTAWHPQSPMVLQRAGLTRCLLAAFDDAQVPAHRAAVVYWPAADGKQVEAFCRKPRDRDDPETGFHIGHYLHETIMGDGAAVLAVAGRGEPSADWRRDWQALSTLAPVLGEWTTLEQFLRDESGGYAPVATPDEFAIDHLDHRVIAKGSHPVSEFASRWRERRQVDADWTWLALLRSLGCGSADADGLRRIEEAIELGLEPPLVEPAELRPERLLAERLLQHSRPGDPGLLVLNPCGFARRVALEIEDFHSDPAYSNPQSPVPHPQPEGPVRAIERDGSRTRLVVDVPALGYSWIARRGDAAAASVERPRLRLADGLCVRNEFLEAEIDRETGGLRALRDLRTRENRVGQQLVFQPGSVMSAESVAVTSSGSALGEITSAGTLRDEHGAVLARFRQRYRVWISRPVLELRIELEPVREPQGYAWHAYFGARFAWRDERATLLRAQSGQLATTTHSRPNTAECLELRSGRLRTQILPLGLPFHQRHGGRMLDVILIPPGESARRFDLALTIDRDYPTQTAWGLLSPVGVVPVGCGPPPAGPSAWLAHLDSQNLMLTSLRPDGDRPAVVARLLEIGGVSGAAALRWARAPVAAETREPDGSTLMPLAIDGDTVHFDYAAHEWLELRVEF